MSINDDNRYENDSNNNEELEKQSISASKNTRCLFCKFLAIAIVDPPSKLN